MKVIKTLFILTAVIALSGCKVQKELFKIRKAMYDQQKFEPLEATEFFGDHRSSRELVPNTIPQGWLREDTHLYEGKVDGQVVSDFPFEVTEAVLHRGQERFNIYCSVCHGKAGYGDGMVVRRGYRQPPSYHIDRLRAATPGYIYGVVKNGFGVMAGYEDQIPVEDRWAIVAYVKTLQLSQHVSVNDLAEADKAKLAQEVK